MEFSSSTHEAQGGFISRFFHWLFSWRTVRRALIALAGLITVMALLWTEENWRGKRAWERCRSELEAKGAVLEWDAYIPPAVPDDQNVFKAPKMQEWFVGRRDTDLSRRLANTNTVIRPIGRLTLQQATNYLDWSRRFEPDFDLIREALKRPYARMDGDYEQLFAMPIPNFVGLRIVAQTLAKRTQCYLLLREPEKALRELTLMRDLCRLLEARPSGRPITLVTAMINVAITGLYVNTIADGLQVQAWREPQLAAIQEQLREISLPPLVAEAFRDERASVCRPLERTPPALLANQRLALTGDSTKLWHRLKDPMFLFCTLAPRGWMFQNMAVYAEGMQKAVEVYDPSNGLVLPGKAESSNKDIQAFTSWSPYTFFTSRALPNYTRAWRTLALNQSLANEALIACALERYRLAHGGYPDMLDALVPQFIARLPHDIIGGQALKYRRTDGGRFLLYSVGWNETDDGGLAASKDGRPSPDQDDWVWQIPR